MDVYDPATRGAVMAFRNDNCWSYASRYMVLADTPDPSQKADYPEGFLDPDYGTDSITAVMVPQGYTLVLYDSGDLVGESKTITGSSWADYNYLMTCIPLGDWNDRAASLSVYRTNG